MPSAAPVRPAGVAAALLFALAMLATGGVAVPAAACACGAVAGTGGTATVNDEVALVHWDGRRQTILMRLALRAEGDRAALVVPTPAPATVAAGSPDTFAELERRTAPEIVTERRFFGTELGGETSGAAPGAAPTVLDQVRLGPLEATTLTGGGLDGIRKWLSDNGYRMRDEVVATLAPYLAEGWSFVAIRLTGENGLDGALDPVQLTFDAAAPVYPMRMSSAATLPQSVRLYVLGAHRVRRADPDAGKQYTHVEFAGRLTETDDPLLRELVAGGQTFLTEFTVGIADPAAITSDWTFANEESDTEHRERITRTEQVQVLGAPAGPVILGAALLAATLVVVAVLRVFRRPPS